MRLSPLNQRRWRNFKRNRRAVWSLIILGACFILSLFAEFIANDKPILVSYRGELRSPVLSFYSEKDFGGDFATEAIYSSIEVKCLIVSGGAVECFDEPEGIYDTVAAGGTPELRISPRVGWSGLSSPIHTIRLSMCVALPLHLHRTRTFWARTIPNAMFWRA